MNTVKVTWKAFGNLPEANRYISSVIFDLPIDYKTNEEQRNYICEAVYADTNLYKGYFWNRIQPLLSPTRTHTALSVGDEIEVASQEANSVNTYRVADFGFDLIKTEPYTVEVVMVGN